MELPGALIIIKEFGEALVARSRIELLFPA